VVLRGASAVYLALQTGSQPREITITFAEDEPLPDGELYATATSRGTVLDLDIQETGGSGDPVEVVVTVDPDELAEYGTRQWSIEAGVLDSGSGSGEEDDIVSVILTGSVGYRVVLSPQIASTVVQEAGS
jgi:hypothetical protein